MKERSEVWVNPVESMTVHSCVVAGLQRKQCLDGQNSNFRRFLNGIREIFVGRWWRGDADSVAALHRMLIAEAQLPLLEQVVVGMVGDGGCCKERRRRVRRQGQHSCWYA
jgi:hypothetical protein